LLLINTHTFCICYTIDVPSRSASLSQMSSVLISILGVIQNVFYKHHHNLSGYGLKLYS